MILYPVFLAVGVFLSFFSILIMIPAGIDYLVGDIGWRGFVYTSILTAILGSTLIFATQGRDRKKTLNNRQALLLTVLIWGITPFFAALPFYLSGMNFSYTDSFFEAMSGLTTTGATVFANLDHMPVGILIWRSALQWLGGVGVVLMAIIILPSLKIGGTQLFRIEFSQSSEKALPRAVEFIAWISALYLSITLLCSFLYWGAGMTAFDAINHAMTTVATGGFSTHDASFSYFNNVIIEIISVLFMILGSLPFILYLHIVLKKKTTLFYDEQVRWFFCIVASATIIVALLLWSSGYGSPASSLRVSVFNITSIITGTGYASDDYDLWGTWAMPVFLFLMMLGGCAGSTTCGIKIFRVIILCKSTYLQIRLMLQPHGLFVAYYNGKPISESVKNLTASFFLIFIGLFIVVSIALSFTGLDFVSALSSAMTSITNVGPALGPLVGPSSTFSSLSPAAKWIMSVAMLLGRLEFFTVLVLLSPYFWKK